MCGHKRRAARCGGAYSAGYNFSQCQARPRGIVGLIEGIQQMRLTAQQQALATTLAPAPAPMYNESRTQAAEFGTQTRGIVYPMVNGDEKKMMPQEESVNFEVLPMYKEVAAVPEPKGKAGEAVPMRSTEAAYMPTSIQLPQHVSRSLPPRGLNELNMALTSYKQGGCGGKCQAKRAVKSLMKELASQEIERYQATHGALVCGQRKQIRKDLAPVKALLKAAIKDARRERVD